MSASTRLFVSALAGVALVLGIGCGSAPRPRFARMVLADPPFDLRDVEDRDQERDRFEAMRIDDPAREPLRAALAAAIVADITRALDRHELERAADGMTPLLSLWQDDPTRAEDGLAFAVPQLRRIADELAQRGVDRGALAARIALAAADRERSELHRDEVEDIIAYLDDLGMAESGSAAGGQLPVEMLEPIARALPSPGLSQRVVGLIAARQAAFNQVLLSSGASFELVRAHTDVFDSARRAAAMLAIARQADAIAATVGPMTGLGAAEALAEHARAVEGGGGPESWLALAASIDGERRSLTDDDEADAKPTDPVAALALLRAAPALATDVRVATAAARYAEAAGRDGVALALNEAALAIAPTSRDALSAGDGVANLRARASERLARGGRVVAARAQRAHVEKQARTFGGPATAARRDAWRAAAALGLGRGLVAQGLLDEAQSALRDAAARQPSAAAYDSLGLIAAKRGQVDAARTAYERAIGLGRNATEVARLHRLAGEAAATAGDEDAAVAHWISALKAWAAMGSSREDRLPPHREAPRLIESAQTLWHLGEEEKALDLFAAASAIAPDDLAVLERAVRFLLLVDRPAEAAVAYHLALGAAGVTDADKTYLGLWIVGDARRRGAAPDRRALGFLVERHGDAWIDQLAAAAVGQRSWAEVATHVTRPSQQAALLYYQVALANRPDPRRDRERLLQVVDAGFISSYEYDDAVRRLAESEQ